MGVKGVKYAIFSQAFVKYNPLIKQDSYLKIS